MGRAKADFFPPLYVRFLRCSVAGLLIVSWEAVKNMHDAKFDNDGTGDEKGK